jgi:hypothetical protein
MMQVVQQLIKNWRKLKVVVVVVVDWRRRN